MDPSSPSGARTPQEKGKEKRSDFKSGVGAGRSNLS